MDTQEWRLGHDNIYTQTKLGGDTAHDTKELRKKINQNIITDIAECQQCDEVLD